MQPTRRFPTAFRCRRLATVAATLLVGGALSGCATYHTTVTRPELAHPYSGTVYDWNSLGGLRGWGYRESRGIAPCPIDSCIDYGFRAADLPLSFVADTLLLPVWVVASVVAPGAESDLGETVAPPLRLPPAEAP